MNDLAKISVVVATLNRADYLKRLLDGLLREDYPNMEIVVDDGASTDGTVDLLKSYGPKVRWISEPDAGEYFAVNKAIAMASGEIIKPICDDDLLRPGALKYGAEYLRDHPDVDIVFGRMVVWDARTPNGEPLPVWESPQAEHSQLKLRNWLRGTEGGFMAAAFLRKRVFDLLGPFETKYVCGDTEFLVRAAFRGTKMGTMPQIVVDYYLTGNNRIITEARKIEREKLAINLRYGTLSDILYWIKWGIVQWRGSWVTGWIFSRPALWFCEKSGIHPLRFLRWAKRKLGVSPTG
jgi:glycosyltransferase involved in cell wall biosynthesis